jgi:glycosidase
MHTPSDRLFYHIYPLGFCGAPDRNDFVCPAGGGLAAIGAHLPRLEKLGVTGLYIGPLFEATSHGYDTVDYFHVDRRLGNNAALVDLVRSCHDHGMMVVLDAVFNHTSRDFFAFKDIQRHRQESPYCGWYEGLDFSRSNEYGDGFRYEGWGGHTNLVKLNGGNPAVREHLFDAARFWIDEFAIDGLRLDAANVMSVDFLRELAARCRGHKSDFWLLGEMVAGDYCRLAHDGCLDSVTNYELYKSLWSSFRDKNFFELSWTLHRQSAPKGLYPHLGLYNFADNHDVNRVASMLQNPAHLFPLYGILFCAPGIPSVYYGSEYGIPGERDQWSDRALRPPWDDRWPQGALPEALFRSLSDFARIRRNSAALCRGSYRELLVQSEQFGFLREAPGERIAVLVNAAPDAVTVKVPQEVLQRPGCWKDLLSGETFTAGSSFAVPLHPSWLRILRYLG